MAMRLEDGIDGTSYLLLAPGEEARRGVEVRVDPGAGARLLTAPPPRGAVARLTWASFGPWAPDVAEVAALARAIATRARQPATVADGDPLASPGGRALLAAALDMLPLVPAAGGPALPPPVTPPYTLVRLVGLFVGVRFREAGAWELADWLAAPPGVNGRWGGWVTVTGTPLRGGALRAGEVALDGAFGVQALAARATDDPAFARWLAEHAPFGPWRRMAYGHGERWLGRALHGDEHDAAGPPWRTSSPIRGVASWHRRLAGGPPYGGRAMHDLASARHAATGLAWLAKVPPRMGRMGDRAAETAAGELAVRRPRRAAGGTLPAAASTVATTPARLLPLVEPASPRACAEAWAAIRQETDAVLRAGAAPQDGVPPVGAGDATPAERLTRNRAISSAYARLAADGDPRFQWAGLASVVSTQAHCYMRTANEAVGKGAFTDYQLGRVPAGVRRGVASLARQLGIVPAEAAEAVSADPTRFGEMAAQVQAALYDTNREIFADIYPALAMYKRHGLTGVLGGPGQCGGMRPDRVMPEELQLALKELDEGNVGDGSLLIAQYEQIRIVQERIYDDPARPLVKPAMRLNQAIAADPLLRRPARLLFGVAPPEVALSTECGDGTPGVSFPGDITVARDRVRYFERLNDAFASKPASWRRAALERIMRRDPLTGGPDY